MERGEKKGFPERDKKKKGGGGATLAAHLCYFQSAFMGPGTVRKHVKDKLTINWYKTSIWCVLREWIRSFYTMGKGEEVWFHVGRFIRAASAELIADERFSRKGSGPAGALAAIR